jgi:YgiT-type zinc finger domain-containing protein
MKCVFCGNKIARDTQTIERRIENHRVYIKNVPVELCKFCGEVYVDDNIVSDMNRILASLKHKEISNTVTVDFCTFKEQSATNLNANSQFKHDKLVTV